MKLRYAFVVMFVLMLGSTANAQLTQYPLVTVQDIQNVPDSLISIVDPPSPLNGDTVRFRGVVLVAPIVSPVGDRRRIIAAGARWHIYIQQEGNPNFGGLAVLQEDTTGDNQQSFFDLLDTAQIVEFTGKINEYFTTTQVGHLINPTTPVQVVGTLPKRPDPIELNISDFWNGAYRFEAEKYEGMYVVIKNAITSDRNASTGVFKINDANGNFMWMYDQSGYFTKRAHRLTGITTYEPPNDGSTLEYIRGVINTRTDGYYITPLYPGDIKVAQFAPTIANIERNRTTVAPNQTVEISANISDVDGFVSTANLLYRVNRGQLNTLAMAKDAGDTTLWKATIPAVAGDSALVDFFIRATDNSGNIGQNPTDTSRNRYFYLVLNRPLTIQDVQYSPYGSGFSAFNGYPVTVSGVVTADTSDIPGFGSAAARVYIQNGNTPWSGIWVSGVSALPLKRGDNITVTGEVREDFSVTQLNNLTSVVVNSSNNPLPAPVVLQTGAIGKKTNNTVDAEQYESVLIQYNNAFVTAKSADGTSNFGEIFISDNSGDTRVELQEGNHSYHNAWEAGLSGTEVQVGAKFGEIKGVLYFSFSNYKLVPRKDADFVNYVVGVEDQAIPADFALRQNYPNPFNPTTTIEYSIPSESFVTLEVFNVLGQSVRSYVNSTQSAGTYKVIFDAAGLSTGMYFYTLRAGNEVVTKKMILVK